MPKNLNGISYNQMYELKIYIDFNKTLILKVIKQ
jgi:hypothetical protein